MPGYKLTYFNLQARAEVARFLFALADVEYEDNRVEFDQWPSLKKDTPFGQLPVFEGDGMVMCQSHCIGRYLANRFGFAGSTPQEKARADMIVDCCEDMIKPYLRSAFNKDEDAKNAGIKKFEEEDFPQFLASFEAILKQYNNGKTFLIRDSITWADVSLFHFVRWLKDSWKVQTPLDKYPKLEAFLERVAQHPKIAKWIKERPKTDR